jgi:protein-tyrosine phosphatase
MAEVVARAKLAEAGLAEAGLADRVAVDSAGTGDWHVGSQMHQGAKRQLAKSGYDGSAHRARQFDASWLAERDLVLAMDASNLAALRHLARNDADHRIRLFGEVAGLGGADIPDPYGTDSAEFARVLGMLESGMTRLVSQLSDLLRTPTQPGR